MYGRNFGKRSKLAGVRRLLCNGPVQTRLSPKPLQVATSTRVDTFRLQILLSTGINVEIKHDLTSQESVQPQNDLHLVSKAFVSGNYLDCATSSGCSEQGFFKGLTGLQSVKPVMAGSDLPRRASDRANLSQSGLFDKVPGGDSADHLNCPHRPHQTQLELFETCRCQHSSQ